jgi:hypothetical protein
MALVRVQATPKATSGTTTLTLSFATAPTVGNGIIVTVASRTEAPVTCTDNYGNTYELVHRLVDTSRILSTYLCSTLVAAGGAFVVTVTTTATFRSLTGSAIEVGGTTGRLRVDRVVSNNGTTATQPSTGATLTLRTTADAFLVAAVTVGLAQASITVESVSPTWLQECEELTSGNGACPTEVDSRLLPAPGGTAQNASWTIASATSWAATLVAFAADTALPPLGARVTQLVAETLAFPTPDARLTQLVAETLTSLAVRGHVSQLVVETLVPTLPPLPDARLTQLVAETLTALPPYALVSQAVVETLTALPSYTHVTQLVAETLTALFVPTEPPGYECEWPIDEVRSGSACDAAGWPIDEVRGGGACPAPFLSGD